MEETCRKGRYFIYRRRPWWVLCRDIDDVSFEEIDEFALGGRAVSAMQKLYKEEGDEPRRRLDHGPEKGPIPQR